MTSTLKGQRCHSLWGHSRTGSTLQASVFSPLDLNVKLLADLHSCDAHCTGAAHSHCIAHVLINMAPTVLSTPPLPSPTLIPSHMLSQHVFEDCVVFISPTLISPLVLPLMPLFVSLCLSGSSLSYHLPLRLLSGMWWSLVLLYLYPAHICAPDV